MIPSQTAPRRSHIPPSSEQTTVMHEHYLLGLESAAAAGDERAGALALAHRAATTDALGEDAMSTLIQFIGDEMFTILEANGKLNTLVKRSLVALLALSAAGYVSAANWMRACSHATTLPRATCARCVGRAGPPAMRMVKVPRAREGKRWAAV